MSTGNVSTVNRLQQMYSSNMSLTRVSGTQGGDHVSPSLWIQEVITPVMISLSCLVLGIAAIILILLVKHYRYEADPSIQYHQVGNIFLKALNNFNLYSFHRNKFT